MQRLRIAVTITLGLIPAAVFADAGLDMLVKQGEELYQRDVSCWVCHGKKGEGLIAPPLMAGPKCGFL